MQDKADGKITIKQFDDQLLRGTLDVKYCRVGNFDFDRKKCTKVENATLEFTKPFGWTYDIDQSFTSIDSPGMRMYRKLSGDMLFGDSGMDWSEIQELGWKPVPQKSSAPGSNGSGSQTAEGGSQNLCECSCAELKEMESAADAMDENMGEDQMPDLNDPTLKKMMTCPTQCMMAYAQCDF
jgi:hypothetical protein